MQKRLYDEAMYRFKEAPATYWHAQTGGEACAPLTGALDVEVAIIGGGFTGLSAALHLARDHGISAVVLEAGDLAWGASSRNAGFNTLAATKLGIRDIYARWGSAAALEFFSAQHEGQALVYELAQLEGFDVEACGDGTYMVAHTHKAWANLQEEIKDWKNLTQIPCRLLDREEFALHGHAGTEQFGALHWQSGGGINPLAFSGGLARAAKKHGAQIYTHSQVQAWEKTAHGHLLQTASGRIHAHQVIVATNAYPLPNQPGQLQRRVLPAISNILVTKPLSEAQWAEHAYSTFNPIFDARHLLHYYRRLPDNRLLFGARGDLSGTDADAALMQQQLHLAMARKFPAWAAVETDYFWRGLVAVTRKMVPSLGQLQHDPSVWYGLGCFGNGVNTMPWMGRTLARRIARAPLSRTEQCAVFDGLPDRMPPGHWLQKLALKLAYVKYAGLDALA